MVRVGNDWFKTALNFMLSLGSGVEGFDVVFYGVFLALVVAGFEMEESEIGGATPVAAEEFFLVLEK